MWRTPVGFGVADSAEFVLAFGREGTADLLLVFSEKADAETVACGNLRPTGGRVRNTEGDQCRSMDSEAKVPTIMPFWLPVTGSVEQIAATPVGRCRMTAR